MIKNTNKLMMNKAIVIMLLIVAVVSVFTGCNGKNNNDSAADTTPILTNEVSQSSDAATEAIASQSENKPASDNFPVTITDALGTELIIDKQPEKIVSLTLGTDEILLSLVENNKIAGLSFLADDPGLSNVTEQARAVEVKLGTDAEQVINTEPDIVFVADWSDADFVKHLRDANIAVFACKTPSGVEDVKILISDVAKITGEVQKGKELIRWMDDKIKAVSDKVSTISPENKKKILSADSFFYTYGSGTTFDNITKHAGLINMASEAGMVMWQQISKEKIVEFDPDILSLPSWSYEGFDAEAFIQDMKTDKSLEDVKAVKNNMVLALPENHMTSVSQYIVLGVEDLAKAAYPDLFR